MSEIRLTPSGQLRWQRVSGEPKPPELAKLQKSFEQDWLEGLFKLAAGKYQTTDSPTLGYWQGFAEHYLTGLCHIPESTDDIVVETPSDSVLSTLLLSAPPMSGGEYLTLSVLRQIWIGLSRWGNQAIDSAGGLAGFLQIHAPKWHQVGRVCFHLAENKSNKA